MQLGLQFQWERFLGRAIPVLGLLVATGWLAGGQDPPHVDDGPPTEAARISSATLDEWRRTTAGWEKLGESHNASPPRAAPMFPFHPLLVAVGQLSLAFAALTSFGPPALAAGEVSSTAARTPGATRFRTSSAGPLF